MSSENSNYENDYATFVIEKQLEALHEGHDVSQIVFNVRQDEINGEGVNQVEMLEENTEEDPEEEVITSRARVGRSGNIVLGGGSTAGGCGYWTDADVTRLLKIYIKVVNKQPYCGGKPNKAMWEEIHSELDPNGQKFTEAQARTKIARLRVYGKTLLASGDYQRIKWPLWKHVKTILDLDEGYNKRKPRDVLEQEEALKLIACYKRHMILMGSAETKKIRLAWTLIAESLGNTAPVVREQFAQLRRRWLRWAENGKDKQDRWAEVMKAFTSVTGVAIPDKPRQKRKRKIDDLEQNDVDDVDVVESVPKKRLTRKVKWTPEGVALLLANYAARLQTLVESDETMTRRDVHELVSKEMNLPLDVLEAKMNNVRTYFVKMEHFPSRQTWAHFKAMVHITKLERVIWLDHKIHQLASDDTVTPTTTTSTTDNSTIVEALEEPVEPVVPVIVEAPEHEPPWFRQYRQEVERRHKDRVGVLDRLVKVMQVLINK